MITNEFAAGERSVCHDPDSTTDEGCVSRAKELCNVADGWDLVNRGRWGGKGCWCQKSRGTDLTQVTNGTGTYKTCRIHPLPVATPTEPDAPPAPTDECLGQWVRTNQFSSGER